MRASSPFEDREADASALAFASVVLSVNRREARKRGKMPIKFATPKNVGNNISNNSFGTIQNLH